MATARIKPCQEPVSILEGNEPEHLTSHRQKHKYTVSRVRPGISMKRTCRHAMFW